MKKTGLFLSLLFMILHMQAQRVDLDRFNFTASYRSYPEDPLPKDFKTYNIRVEASPSLGLGYYGGNQYADQLQIEGLKKTEGTGHVTFLLMMDDIIFEKSELKERIQTSKDKQGVETKKSFFSTELVYSFAARTTLYDYKGNSLVSNKVLFDRDRKMTHKTSEFASAEEATDNYNKKISDTRSGLAKQLIQQVIQQMNAWMNSQYGFPVQRINDILWVLNNKRHAAYNDHQKAWNDFKNAIVLMSPDEPLDNVREKMKPVIDFYNKEKEKYNSSDREHKKLRYSCFYNLAKIYLYLDEPENAMREADALAMNDYDEKDGKMLRASAESLQKLLQRNNAMTRHFSLNTDVYEPPVK